MSAPEKIHLKTASTDRLLDTLINCIDANPDNCPPDLLDEIALRIQKDYRDTAQLILDEEAIEAKREKIIDWIRNEDTVLIVAFSGGKDSIAMVLYLLDLGVPAHRIELWHHEVDGMSTNVFDWPCTPSYCKAFADHFGCPILFSYREGGITREIFKGYNGLETSQNIRWQSEPDGPYHTGEVGGTPNKRLMFPAKNANLQIRWCSPIAKIEVMQRAINNMPRLSEADIVVFTGERRAESTARNKYEEIEVYRNTRLGEKRKALIWRSIIDMDDTEVWALLEKHKIQPHPAYELGWDRCSCQTCIFNSRNTWATLAELAPNKIKQINKIEKEIDFTLVSGIELPEYAAEGTSYLDPEVAKIWKDQALGEFTAPIVVDNWKLPQGANSLEQCGAN